VEYGSDADKTQLSLDVLRRLKQRSHDLHQEVQTCCAYKVPHSSQLLSCAQGTVVVVSEQNSASHLTQSYLE